MKTLIITDIQNDFVEGGRLPVPGGRAIVDIVNRLQKRFGHIVAVRDWHPPDHGSFAVMHPGAKPGDIVELAGLPQVLWPVHCVQNTPGAEYVAELDRSRWDRIFSKGVDRAIDSYSGFHDNGRRRSTGLAEHLSRRGTREIVIVGLATDYCIKFTALDGIHAGFRTTVIENACRGINLHPGDVARALDDMRAAGVRVIQAD